MGIRNTRPMSTLNVLVTLWLLITSAGVVYGVRLVRRAEDALQWLKDNRLNGYRMIAAHGAIRRGYIRVAISVDMVLMGVIAGTTQFALPGSDVRNALSGVFRLLFISMAVMFTYKAYMEDHELDMMINESQRSRVYVQNDTSAMQLSIEQIDSQDKNTEEVRLNTLATEANTIQRQEDQAHGG